ncbi:AAA family ATPase [Thermococcus aggregans]|uniref:ORC1-type DNA replication protein n=1 Tax=Thermococcus aggregans TaxID=110163 RepID=A0A9E7SNT5_THEAG|nr:AAA family ATPase [Thermococcus aggregans]USS40137.1 AAA family ATPase [Thermococcus aggregans]
MVNTKINLKEIIRKEFQSNNILKNPSVLTESYVPEYLLFRENEVTEIARHFGRYARGIHPGHLLIHGPPSTGKTHAIKLVIKTYTEFVKENDINSKILYINCKDRTYYQTLITLLHNLGINFPERGLGIGEAIDALVTYLKNSEERPIFVFDEIDKLKKTYKDKEDPMNALIYRMSRLDEVIDKEGPLIVMISNKANILERIEHATIAKFIPRTLYFREYNSEELFEILRDRAEKALLPGSFDDESIRYLVELIKQNEKDLRWGFKILTEAALRTSEKLTKEIINEAMKSVERNILHTTINSLTNHQLVILWSIAFLEENKILPVTGEVYQTYKLVCEELGWRPRSMRHVMHYITPKIESIGLITSREKGLGRGKGRTLVFHLTENSHIILKTVEMVLSERLHRKFDPKEIPEILQITIQQRR